MGVPDPEHGCGTLENMNWKVSHVMYNWTIDFPYVSRKQREMST
jgi:hypothetical protein